MIERGTFSTNVVTLEILCVKIPDDLSFDEASTMFFPYVTATHSLITVGGIKKGQVSDLFFFFLKKTHVTSTSSILTKDSLCLSIVHVVE